MGRKYDRDIPPNAAQQIQEAVPLRWIQSCRGFVHDNEPRLPEQRLYWERSAAAYFALDMLPAEEPLEAFLARVHAEDRAAVAAALSLESLTAAGVSLPYRVRLGNGAQRRHLLRARPLRVASGWRVLGLLEDVTGPRREDEPRPRQERGHA